MLTNRKVYTVCVYVNIIFFLVTVYYKVHAFYVKSRLHPKLIYIIFLFQASNRVPKLTINLGPRCDSGSNGGLSSPAKKHHHKHKKHKKKRKRQIDSDDEDDDVVELSNDSDEDYRV